MSSEFLAQPHPTFYGGVVLFSLSGGEGQIWQKVCIYVDHATS